MYLGGNLKLLRKLKKKSQEDVSKELGLTRSTYSGYENGVAEPGIETLVGISNYYLLPLDDLIKKDFSKLKEKDWESIDKGVYADIKGQQLRILTTTVNAENEEIIEMISQKASAGYTSGYADPDYIKVLPTFSLPFLSKNRKYRSFPIQGDSMPPVGPGSHVVGEFVQNWATIKSGTPCVIVTKEDGIVFKIVNNKLDSTQSFQLCSTNPLYTPYMVHVNEIIEIWKFVNYISPDLPDVKMDEGEMIQTMKQLQAEVHELKNSFIPKNKALN